MGRVKKSSTTLDDLLSLAKEYQIENNALFLSTINQYALQQRVISNIKDYLDANEITATKTYIKGQENVYANPLIKELPKHSDSANKTAELILKIITSLGTKTEAKQSKLSELMNK